jgi:signal transduction histidine kinase
MVAGRSLTVGGRLEDGGDPISIDRRVGYHPAMSLDGHSLADADPTAPPRRPLAATLAGLLGTAVRAFDADAAGIYLVDAAEGDLVLAAGHGLPPSAVGHRLAVGEGLVGRVAAEARSLVSDDVGADPRALHQRADWETPPPVHAFLGLPLRAGVPVLGVLELTSRQPGAFSPDARGQASILADAAALLIEQTRLAELTPLATRDDEPVSLGGGDPLGIATLNRRLLFTSASQTFCLLTGQAVEALIGRPALTVLPFLGRSRAGDALQAALRGVPGHLANIRLTDRAGRPTREVYSVTLIPLADPLGGTGERGGDAGGGILMALQDATARARLENELRQQSSEANEARERLRAVIEVVSHELRTPLTSVLGYAHLLHDRPDADAERRAEWASLVIDKARVLSRQVDEITELARLGSLSFTLKRRAFDPADVIRAVVADVQTAVPSAEITLLLPRRALRVDADPDRIAQVLANLVGNAVKYGPIDRPITIELTGDSTGARMAVIDQGETISADDATRIFEPFVRRPSPAVRGTRGTGLGLAVARGIVEAHGGRLWHAAGASGGNAFYFTLPAEASEGVPGGVSAAGAS